MFVLTKEHEIRRRMTDKFDERFSHGLTSSAVRCNDVSHAQEWKQQSYPNDLEGLQDHVLASKSWKSLVPDGC